MTEQRSGRSASGRASAGHGGELIGKAFRRSLLVIAGLALVVAGAVWVIRRDKPESAPMAEQAVLGPAARAPVTALEPPAVRFTDVSEQAGIDFVHVNGAYGDKLLPETMGAGVAFLDYDHDGDQDLLFVNGTYWPGHAPKGAKPPTMGLYRNDGKGRFENVSTDSGLDGSFYGMGVAVGDYDNDGWVDVFITAVGANRLYRNERGTFREVTELAGVAGSAEEWSTGTAFLDYDRDGDLDLFVANYVRWSPQIDFEVAFSLSGIGRAYGPPTTFAGSHPYLYRNEGGGRFEDVSAAAGVQVANPATGAPMGKGLGVAPVDVDDDGWIDLMVANDTVQNFLFRNQGDGTFREQGVDLGLAFDRNGSATGAMGIDAADFRNDGALGFAVGNFANEMSSLYVAQGKGMPFADEAIVAGIGPATRLVLSFGLFFFDYDLDGRLDLFQANGHLEEAIHQVQASQHYEQRPQLFWNCGPDCPATFLEAPADTLGDLSKPLVGRAAAYADIDQDGDLDLALTQPGRRAVLLRNDQDLGHRWLRVQLRGNGGNRDALGAWVELQAGGTTQRRQVMPTRSYLSQVELPLTFGLGSQKQVDTLRIRWPDGSTQEFDQPGVDRLLRIEQASTMP